MPAAGATPILHYASATAGHVPAAANMVNSTGGSELAINITDGKLFYKDNTGVVQVIGVLMPGGVLPVANGGTGTTTSILPPGSMLDFAGTAAPAGFLLCDGSAVSRSTYAALFASIGTTWGAGDGLSTFNLPNMQRRTSIGSGGTAISGPANTVGSVGGEEAHVLVTGELASHTHTISDPGHNHGVNDPGHNHGVNDPGHNHGVNDPGHSHYLNLSNSAAVGGGFGGADAAQSGVTYFNTAPSQTGISIAGNATGIYLSASGTRVNLNAALTGISAQSVGSNTAHNTMQPSAVVTKIIKF